MGLTPGVNVIVGLKDTGKTSWLRTISYLLGSTEGPEKALGVGLATKFNSASLELSMGDGDVISLERRWREHACKHRIFVDGDPIDSEAFSEWLCCRLGIPRVRFPRGNPHSGATWSELSWRMLFRHAYREEQCWSELAERQPEREQHACLIQFLGGAEQLFPQELADEVKHREDLLSLRARRDQFDDVLKQAVGPVFSIESFAGAPTLTAIDQAVERLRNQISVLLQRRDAVLSDMHASREPWHSEAELSEERLRLVAAFERVADEKLAAETRITELQSYLSTVSAEIVRIKRVEVASEVFKPLRVQHCPHCDQKLAVEPLPSDTCFVCHQSLPVEWVRGWPAAKQRLSFENEQLRGEAEELAELVQRVQSERAEVASRMGQVEAAIHAIDVALRPVRAGTAALLPAGLGTIDTTIGQLEERVAQVLRVRAMVAQQDQLTSEIDALAEILQTTSAMVEGKEALIPFEQMSDAISEGMNEYISILKAGDPQRWTHGPLRIQVGERAIRVMVGGVPLSRLGATSRVLAFLGYHYALLKVSGVEGFNYPGLAIIDFPVTLSDGASIASHENYLLEPFVSLAMANPNIQVVICGREFSALAGVNRVPLTRVWILDDTDPRGDLDPQLSIRFAEPGLDLTVAAHFHSRQRQIMMVLGASEVRRLAGVLHELGADIAAGRTWQGKDVIVRWGGGEFQAKLVHHIDNGNVKFTVRKRFAADLWEHLDRLLRANPSNRRFAARYVVAEGDSWDVFYLNIAVPGDC